MVKQAFSDAYNYMKNGTLLRQVINKLNEIDFTRASERHLFGDIYEQILRDLGRRATRVNSTPHAP